MCTFTLMENVKYSLNLTRVLEKLESREKIDNAICYYAATFQANMNNLNPTLLGKKNKQTVHRINQHRVCAY